MLIHIDAQQIHLPGGLIGWTVKISAPIEGPLTGRNVISAKSVSPNKHDAVNKAISIVDQMATNPVIAALMPPGTAAAVTLTKDIAQGLAHGKLHDVVEKYGGIATATYGQIQRFAHWLHH